VIKPNTDPICPYKGIYGNWDKSDPKCRKCWYENTKLHFECRAKTHILQANNPFKNNEKMAK